MAIVLPAAIPPDPATAADDIAAAAHDPAWIPPAVKPAAFTAPITAVGATLAPSTAPQRPATAGARSAAWPILLSDLVGFTPTSAPGSLAFAQGSLGILRSRADLRSAAQRAARGAARALTAVVSSLLLPEPCQ
jgi:hypothetical protein